ncbi:MAG: hypothetical protein SA339_05005 [Methanomassiliicoccus sp.]|nr:hypothetical protein [Methanomassiliicoccus sp.]
MEANELAELFERNGLRRIEAKALAIFIDGRPRSSMEIELEGNLRQPEVSFAMPRMVGRGWFTVQHFRKEGKGRPYFTYTLAKAFDDICKDIAGQQSIKIAAMMNDLNALRTVA